MAYFYYQKNPFGRWAPCKSEDPPTTRTADGAQRKITQIIEIQEKHEHVPLDYLTKLYPLKEA